MEIAKGLGRLFYLISPNETAIRSVDEVPHPDYVAQAVPYFLTLIVLEYGIQLYKNQRRARLNDSITSLSHGMYLGCQEMLTRGLLHYAYVKIYESWTIYELPWNSPWTWYTAALTVDFCYYWVHRAAHEVNFFWAKHQVHHSSEEYNLTTALRQSALQHWLAWPFYLPLALFVPPSIFLIHQQFNLLYQFWIHTELVDNLGPLEWILNTPRHHRIHHGSNRYCLDKNYGGVLIIWDRIFGTFAQERENEPIVYGLVEQVQSFNPFWLQFFHYPKIWAKASTQDKWSDKLSAILKGPGWTPDKPNLRLGDPNDCPEVPLRKKYDVHLSPWKNIYAGIHFLVTLAGFDYLSRHFLSFNQLTFLCSLAFILFSLTSVGLVLEDRGIGALTEIGRCTTAILLLLCVNNGESASSNGQLIIHPFLSQALIGIFGLSVGLWSIYFTLRQEFERISNKKRS